MLQKLTELGRIDWLKHDFAELTNPAHYAVAPEKAWFKIKGKNKLTGKQLSIIQTLGGMARKNRASRRPPKKLAVRDELLVRSCQAAT